MMRNMSYFTGMNLGKTVKEAVVRVLTIPTATPPFRLGYKPSDDDLLELELELRRMDRAKAKEKGLPSSLEPLKPYTLTLNGKFVKAGDSQHY